MNSRYFGSGRKIVVFWLPQDHKKRMDSADARLSGVVDFCIGIAASLQFLDTRSGLLPQFIHLTKLNGPSGTRFRTSRHEPSQLAVVAERALESESFLRSSIDHSEGTGDDTIPATVAHIGLHIDRPNLGADDRASGACF